VFWQLEGIMACTQNDFEEGGTIYVRGKKAICKRTDDYPLIFWSFDDNPDILFHRNLKDDADMFSIIPPKGQSEDNIESKETAEVNETTGDADANSSVPKISEYKNYEDDQVVIDVSYPGVVRIEKCLQTTFTLEHKVSNIILIDCKDVEVNFVSVASTCEATRLVDCQISCQEYGSFTLDNCQKIQIQFPQTKNAEDELNVRTTGCDDVKLVAKKHLSGQDDADLSYSIEAGVQHISFQQGSFSIIQDDVIKSVSSSKDQANAEASLITEEKNTDGTVGVGSVDAGGGGQNNVTNGQNGDVHVDKGSNESHSEIADPGSLDTIPP